jgi:hypothetical protein
VLQSVRQGGCGVRTNGARATPPEMYGFMQADACTL